jgi:hypothetical protein
MESVSVHKKDNYIRRRPTNLVPDAAAFESDKHGSTPTVLRAASCHTAAVITAEDKRKLLVARNDRYALCPIQQVMRYSLIRCIHDFFEDLGSLLGPSDVVVTIGSLRK